ncbi:hypothetical protein KIN20_007647 [Parelaphostrongylus tenuis]|uniref:Uncharacterized protein n=1 Tax=Parelaphostrongylus tenuis TaxID=148309 RepID=A0AAD5M3N9_PARTN|nr:hypothetical protein KIN20_007647 [Parelaphostrongylus tenuis]
MPFVKKSDHWVGGLPVERLMSEESSGQQVANGGVSESSDVETEADEESTATSSANDGAGTLSGKRKAGIRGSDSKEIQESSENPEEDADPGVDSSSGMRGIAMYSSNTDDPYVTLHVDSDEEEKEEIEVKSDDNMVVLAKIDKDNYTMEVFIYNEENNDWYCHHDYLLDAPPLCLEPIQYDPGNNETGKGNLIAVGTMESVINIWDLDIMNAVVPVVNLGSKKKGRRKKRDGREQGHSDAVISLAWNKVSTHVLASGGADRRILLWDLDEAKVAQAVPERSGEIQALSWHPAEHSYILVGTLSGAVEVIDCNESSGIPSASWNFETQVEQVKWNHFNPFSAFFATEDGILYHVDMRKPGEIIWRGQAHDGSVGGLTLSPTVRGLLVTVGHDQMLCVWKVQDDGALLKIHSERQHVGALHTAQFNPDVPTNIRP